MTPPSEEGSAGCADIAPVVAVSPSLGPAHLCIGNIFEFKNLIAATSCPHLAQRPLLLGVLRPVAKLPPSLAVTTSTCCWQPETWT